MRTSDDRHGGLTQFIVDRDSPGLTVSPIPFIDGSSDFCEIHFDGVFVPDSQRLGEVGAGWAQNTGELALERGGVDRWMSMVPLLVHWARTAARTAGPAARADLGSITARAWAFRGLSLSVARMVDQGCSPSAEAALVKEMATRFEQECLAVVVRHLGRPPDPGSADPYEALLAKAVLTAPSWTIRGGTNEILRTVIMKGLRSARGPRKRQSAGGTEPAPRLGPGGRQAAELAEPTGWVSTATEPAPRLGPGGRQAAELAEPTGWVHAALAALVEDVFRAESGPEVVARAEDEGLPDGLWRAVDGIGLPRIGLPEDRGGAGGLAADTVAVLVGSGRHAVPLPLLETWLAGLLLSEAGEPVATGPATATLGRPGDTLTVDGGRADGVLTGVAWARSATVLVAALPGGTVAVLDPAGADLVPGHDLAGMPSDTLTFTGAPARILPVPRGLDRIGALAGLGRAAQLSGAIDAAFALTLDYVEQRHQFGRPLGSFQPSSSTW